MKVLLDTCTFVWLTSAPQRLSEGARAVLNDQDNELYLSQASFWEIAEKVRQGRLRLPDSPQNWINVQMKVYGVEEVLLSADVIFLGAGLAGEEVGLMNRFLVAHSIREGFTLLSPDASLLRLGARAVW